MRDMKLKRRQRPYFQTYVTKRYSAYQIADTYGTFGNFLVSDAHKFFEIFLQFKVKRQLAFSFTEPLVVPTLELLGKDSRHARADTRVDRETL